MSAALGDAASSRDALMINPKSTLLAVADVFVPGALTAAERDDFTVIRATVAGLRPVRDAFVAAFVSRPPSYDGAVDLFLRIRARRPTFEIPPSDVFRPLADLFYPRVVSFDSFQEHCRRVAEGYRARIAPPRIRGVATKRPREATPTPIADAQPAAGTPEILTPRIDAAPPSRTLRTFALLNASLRQGLDTAEESTRVWLEAERLLAATPSVETLTLVRDRLDAAKQAIEDRQLALPHDENFRVANDAATAFADAIGVGPDDALDDTAWTALGSPFASNAMRAAGATARLLRDVALPVWLHSLGTGTTPTQRVLNAAPLVSDPVFREDLRECVAYMESLDEADRADIVAAPDPGAVGAPLEKLKVALARLKEERSGVAAAREAIDRIRDELIDAEEAEQLLASWPESGERIALLDSRSVGWRRADRQLTPQPRAELRTLAREANQEVWEKVLADIADVAGEECTDPGSVIDRSSIRSIQDQAARYRRMRGAPALTMATARSTDIDHPMARREGGTYAAHLVWSRAEGPTSRSALPMRLKVAPLADADFTVLVRVHRGNDVIGTTTLEVPRGATEVEFSVDVVLTNSVVDHMLAQRSVFTTSIELNVAGAKTNFERSWQIQRLGVPGGGALPFVDAASVEDLQRCRLGIEQKYELIRNHVLAGKSSFLVVSPRRFGKTSTLRALERELRDAVSVRVVEHVRASGRSYETLWSDIAARVEQVFEEPVSTKLDDGLVPEAGAFDRARVSARSRGIEAIYVLIDEAQALFTTIAARRLSDRLRERMEDEWGKNETRSGKPAARLLLGLVGQPHLQKLLRANLAATPTTFAQNEFDPDQIERLLRAGATELHSSAAARRQLARIAGNLNGLKLLLLGVLDVCVREQRTWFLASDVDAAIESLVKEFEDTRRPDLLEIARDPLNESDDLDFWEPSDAYPVALAWARAVGEGVRDVPTLKQRVISILTAWLSEGVLIEARVLEQVDFLISVGVLRADGTFVLPLLERLLRVMASSPEPLRDNERETLRRLGIKRVRPPPPQQSDDGVSGGQASVYAARYQDQKVAVRLVRLRDDASRRRFFNELTSLDQLDAAIGDDRHFGAAHLPRLIDSGLAAEESNTGVVIYRWIDGHPIQPGALKEPALVEVALQIARALSLLAATKVIHRDVRPANILYNPHDHRAVLIDFGLARLDDSLRLVATELAGDPDFVPPEVRDTSDATRWSTGGDTFSLGRTLLRCHAGPIKNDALAQLVAEMTNGDPQRRPDAATAVARLELIQATARMDDHRRAIERQAETLLSGLPQFMKTAKHARNARLLASARDGYLGTDRTLLESAACFLEDAFTDLVNQHAGVREVLATGTSTLLRAAYARRNDLRASEWAVLTANSSEAVGLLRNAFAHSEDESRNFTRALRTLGIDSLATKQQHERLRRALLDVAHGIDQVAKTQKVKSIVDSWLTTT